MMDFTNILADHEQQIEAEYPPEGVFVALGDWNMHVVTRGIGPDVILLHGAGGSTRDMSFRLMPELEKSFRVTAIDRPGHGWTTSRNSALVVSPMQQAALIWALIEHMGISRPVILGQSYGGSVAIAMAGTCPGRARGYSLISAAATNDIEMSRIWSKATVVRAHELLAAPYVSMLHDRIITNALEGLFAPNSVPEGYIKHFGPRMSLRKESYIHKTKQILCLKAALGQMMQWYATLPDHFDVLHGDMDRLLPIGSHAIPFAGLAPKATLHTLTGAGHMPHQTHTDEVVRSVQRIADLM